MDAAGIIFDLDGVLLDTVPAHFEAWQRSFRSVGVDFDAASYREHVDGRPVRDGARAVIGDHDEAALEAVVAMKERLYTDIIEAGEFKVFADVPPILQALSRRGIPQAVASSNNQARRLLALANLSEYFEAIICGDDVACGKPAPDIFLVAAGRLGLPPARCIVVEDSIAGLSAARDGGFIPIALLRNGDSVLLPQVKRTITSLRDLQTELAL
ncbi:beta-phosphoglucomutase [Palleronia aestuarii]|uniref:Beta-phosphoglucomutase n=1 Tax=Palleronia aestuarii TaxID=568105 RepID=A0A2W7NKR1_9RHOB|nr:beta-phosphoglucomutase family hydrolase [Palleronia aestuarii]PZX11882.1 beta-phosphoglucomutase [Palleronia aestuarii]